MPQCAPWVDNPVGRYQIVTSGTRPTGSLRPTGAVIYETDTGRWLFWTGSDWAALSSSTVGYAQIVANQTGITTITDITSLTVTFTAVAGRRYRITGSAFLLTTVSGDVASLVIADGAGTQLNSSQVDLRSSSTDIRGHVFAVVVPGAGSKTYKLRASRVSGTGSISVDAGATYPAFILVEDIGV